jgi:hypothetical protein
MKKLLVLGAVSAALAAAVPLAAFGAGSDPNGRATFLGLRAGDRQATLRVRYQCASGDGVWVSAKQTRSGVSAAKLMKEGSSKVAAAWWESHRNKFVCNGKPHTGMFTVDKVEKGSKGRLVGGTAWVQFCVTKGHTERDAQLILSESGWVKVASDRVGGQQ